MEKTTMSVQELSAHMGISLPKAYELVKEVHFENAFFRHDIGKKAMEVLK